MMDLHSEAKRFDPDGEYIRRWLPVLARLPTGVWRGIGWGWEEGIPSFLPHPRQVGLGAFFCRTPVGWG